MEIFLNESSHLKSEVFAMHQLISYQDNHQEIRGDPARVDSQL